MRNIPLECLPKATKYYSATQITHRGETRFDIKTTMYNPEENNFFLSKRPIESILLYHYKTPLSSVEPVPLVNHKLTQIDLGMLNSTNAKDPAINSHDNYRNRLCFSFPYSNTDEFNDGWTIQLPKLVLARDLFFSHPYLLRAALFSERYTTDILVDRDDTEAFHIFVAPNRKITAKDLNDPVFLKKLALILLHPELNQSFLSIYEKTIRNQAQSKAYDFDIDAPILKNIELNVDGCIHPEKKIFRIERINSFRNLETGIDKPVQFHFISKKNFGKVKNILDKKQDIKKQPSSDKSRFDDEANADIDQQIAQLKNITGEIYTIEDLQISLNTSCSEINIQRRNTNGEAHHEDQSFAGGEGDDEGTRPGFTIESETYFESSTYQDLSKMLRKIEDKGYKVQQIHNQSFIKYGRFRGHKLTNGQDRLFYVNLIFDSEDNELFYLCEIDTSDGKKNISTLLLPSEIKADKMFIDENLKSFKIAILSQSLSWPKDFINKVCNIQSYMMINHLSKKDHLLSSSYHEDWADRILEKWKSMHNSL
ncbi:Tn7-like element transposition protein TnsE [Acinetobacter lwoffii]|uniref:Tn7-like element transposition protein TnsE n=1 Tax=Acinetobacter lwoffii TaxID=28090 RepID=UPI00209800E7|nr:Tn7-like element transposition protein TnsE [Acinetobacter lwoffii]